jgi:hypothetical protein
LTRRHQAGTIGSDRARTRAQHSVFTKIEAGNFPTVIFSGLRGSSTDSNGGQQGDNAQSPNKMWNHY